MILHRIWLRRAAVVLLLTACVFAQQRHDPLTEQETDQMRDTALNPNERFKLYIKFVDARLLAIEQLRADPKMAADRGARIHDLLQDVSGLVGETEDNIDAYEKQDLEMRKGLQAVIEATSSWQLRLRALKDAGSKDSAESRDYYFILDTAIDSVNELADDARQTLQEIGAKKKKH
jgi:hypothetical protein